MNFFQMVIKQMRQRSLSTWLTLISVLLGVSLAVAIMILSREGQSLFAQTDFGYDIIIGPPTGSPITLTLNTVYHLEKSPGVIPFVIYEDMARKTPAPPGHVDYRFNVRSAIPFMVGDSYSGRRIVGTSTQMFGIDEEGQPVKGEPFQYRKGESYKLAEGRIFAPRKFEAVIGSDTAQRLGMKLYSDKLTEKENIAAHAAFQATHGMPVEGQKPDIHKPVWHVVGILKQTHTANDRVLFVPYISLYAIAEHDIGMLKQAMARQHLDPSKIPPEQLDEELRKLGYDPANLPESVKREFKLKPSTAPARSPQDAGELMKDTTPAVPQKKEEQGEDPDVYHLDAQGNIVPDLPKEEWELSAILVTSRGPFQSAQLMYNFQVIDNRASAVNPAGTMREFFSTFLAGSKMVLLIISAFVTVVAAASIMTTIYNSVSARRREIAILRALGATRVRILALISFEASLIGAFGGIGGFLAGHLLSAAGSFFLQRELGEGINWMRFGSEEVLYLLAVVLLAFCAGLVPALTAYRTPVATNLTTG